MWCKRWFVNVSVVLSLGFAALGCEVAEDDLMDGGNDSEVTLDAGKPGPRAGNGGEEKPVDAGHGGRDATVEAPEDAGPDSVKPDGGPGAKADAGDAGHAVDDEDAGFTTGEDAGSDDDDGGSGEEIEIAGTWQSNFGGTEVIDSNGHTSWGATSAIVEYDNVANYFISQNPADDFYSPNKFNKIVWTEISGGAFYYCFVDFGLDSAADARNTSNTADASDPDNGGCGGFAWTKLSE